MGIIFDEYGNLRPSALLGAVALGIAILPASCGFLNGYEYSFGSRAGVVNKISHKGMVWKTYEGEMALEGIVSSGGNMGANTWEFSIDNQARHGENKEELARKLNEALESGQKVKIN